MEIREVLERHKRVALHFSGGKDSLCTLHLVRPYWDKITVAWVNTGAAFPETVELMAEVRGMVPHFLEVHSDQPTQNAREGPPADVVSTWDTIFGRGICENREFKVQAVFSCCSENIWMPMHRAMMEGKFTLVLRGQRNSERRKGFIRSGHVEDGIEYYFPLENWSEADVRTFLQANSIDLPHHYNWFNTSGDCMNCSAYLDENKGKLEYLEEYHPLVAKEVVHRLQYIRRAALTELKHLDNVLEAYAHC